MSYFNSKPKEVNKEWILPGADKPTPIPNPPDGLLREKEYIVFHKITFQHLGHILYNCITSFGRFFQYYGEIDLWVEVTSDIRMSAMALKKQLPNYRPFYINQGCIELIQFLDNTGRLLLIRHGHSGENYSSQMNMEMAIFISKLLNFFCEMFPDSIITETNNDPDKYFSMGNVNPEVVEIIRKMNSELDSWDREMDESNKGGGGKKKRRKRSKRKKSRRKNR